MSDSPLVSVVMPVYNTERYVAQAIESILRQTFHDFELLILDDGSTDRSLKVLQQYAQRDDRIQLVSRENRGIPATRNELLRWARGEFVAPMDSDDIALPDRLAQQVKFLRQYPEVICVGGAYQIIDHKGRLLLAYFAMPREDAEIQRLMLVGHVSLHQPCVLFRRQAVLSIGGYDETLPVCEDMDLWLRLGEIGQLVNLPEPVLQYRIYQHSTSEQNQADALNKMRQICEHAWQRRGMVRQFEAVDPWRPLNNRQSRHQFMTQYGWWAFNSGQRQTAIVYSLKAIWALPLELEGWRLLVCALLKAPPPPTPDP